MKGRSWRLAAAGVAVVVTAATFDSAGSALARKRKEAPTDVVDAKVTFPDDSTDRVSGRLTSTSGRCVGDRVVVVDPLNPGEVFEGTSQEDGSFVVDLPAVARPGSAPMQYDIQVIERTRRRVICLAASERVFGARGPDGIPPPR